MALFDGKPVSVEVVHKSGLRITVKRGLVGAVLSRFEAKGLSIVALDSSGNRVGPRTASFKIES